MTAYAQRIPIPDGVPGTYATLDIAAQAARDSLGEPPPWCDIYLPLWIRRKIYDGTVDPRDTRAVLQKWFDYVRANVGFVQDPMWVGGSSLADYVQTPHATLFVEGAGDCLAHAGLLDAGSMALGHGAKFRIVHADPADPNRFSHVYAVFGFVDPMTGGEFWIPADSSLKTEAFGYEVPNLSALRPEDYPVAPAA